MSPRTLIMLAALAAFAEYVPAAQAAVIVVDSHADIFNAGSFSPARGGIMPPSIEFAPNSNVVIEVSSVTGTMKGNFDWPLAGGDGGTSGPGGTQGTNIFSQSGISGIINNRFLFLTGVFVGDPPPTPGMEPPWLNFATLGITSTDFSPLLNQTFFIGDGRTGIGDGRGTIQRFHAPEWATHLYLGLVDGPFFGYPNGANPGAYADNTGSFTVTVNAVPEPSGLLLAGIGAVAVVLRATQMRRRTRSRAIA